MNDQSPIASPPSQPAAPPSREQQVLDLAKQVAADMGLENWSPDGSETQGTSETPPSPPAPPSQSPAEPSQTSQTSRPPSGEQEGEDWDSRLSSMSEDEIDRIAASPQVSKRALRRRVEEAIRLASVGRHAEIDPEMRKAVLDLFQADRSIAEPLRREAYEQAVKETEQDTERRLYYEKLQNLQRKAKEGDSEAEALWWENADEYTRWMGRYEVWKEQRDRERQQQSEQVDIEKAKAQWRSESESALVEAQIKGWMAGLTTFRSLPVEEQDKVYDEWLKESGGDLEKLYAAGTKWELDQRYQKYSGERTGKRAEDLAREALAQQQLESLPNPDTSSGGSPKTFASIEEAAKALNNDEIDLEEYQRQKRLFHFNV